MDDTVLGATVAPAAAPAAGVGDVFKATREFVADHLHPLIMPVEDPDTGLCALAVIGNDSVEPLPTSFFDSVRDEPRFRRGTASMTALASFIAHIKRFGDANSAVFADDSRTAPKLTAVLDYHEADDEAGHGRYRHGKHRTTFAFPLSDEWKSWTGKNGVVMTMAQFALFLEDRIGDIALAGDDFPEDVARFVAVNGGESSIADYATLIELSRGLKVYEQANVEEATNLASGEGHIRFSVEHETRGRSGGTLKVPTMFFIAIPIFNKGPFYRIAARLRYRKTAEGVKFWFDLYRSDRSFDHAFAEAVEKVDAETPASVFFGAPEA
ncbi:YfdQ family protein [Sphingomonas sp. WKB10]|nr:YfdQ family protein [Sphingomonas sp. WKB10]